MTYRLHIITLGHVHQSQGFGINGDSLLIDTGVRQTKTDRTGEEYVT